jgi:hypothetical protein
MVEPVVVVEEVWVPHLEEPEVLLGVVLVVEEVPVLGRILLVEMVQQTLVEVEVVVHITTQIIKVETAEKV